MEILGFIFFILFLLILTIIFILCFKFEIWSIKFLNDKFKIVDKSKFNDIINLYKDLSIIDKIKFRYIVNYTNFLDSIKEEELK